MKQAHGCGTSKRYPPNAHGLRRSNCPNTARTSSDSLFPDGVVCASDSRSEGLHACSSTSWSGHSGDVVLRNVLLSRQRPSEDSEEDEADRPEDGADEKHEGKIAALYANNPDPQEAKGK